MLNSNARAALIEAYCQLAQDRPASAVTVTEIAQRAGYNRVTFYRHFTDVADLEEQLMTDLIADLVARLRPQFKAGQTAEFLRAVFAFCREHRAAATLLLGPQRRVAFVNRVEDTIFAEVPDYIKQTPHNRVAMRIYHAGVATALYDWLTAPQTVSEAELLRLCQSLFADWFLPNVGLRRSTSK